MFSHLTETDATAYIARVTSRNESARIEEHYLSCPQCVDLLKRITNEQLALPIAGQCKPVPMQASRLSMLCRIALAACLLVTIAMLGVTGRQEHPAMQPWEIVRLEIEPGEGQLISSLVEASTSDRPKVSTSDPSKASRRVTIESSTHPLGTWAGLIGPRRLFDPPPAATSIAIGSEVIIDSPEPLSTQDVVAYMPYDYDLPELPEFRDKPTRLKRVLARIAKPLRVFAN